MPRPVPSLSALTAMLLFIGAGCASSAIEIDACGTECDLFTHKVCHGLCILEELECSNAPCEADEELCNGECIAEGAACDHLCPTQHVSLADAGPDPCDDVAGSSTGLGCPPATDAGPAPAQ